MAHRTPGPGKFRFAYAQGPAKQTHNRDVRSTTQKPQELRRIHVLLPRVCSSSGSGPVGDDDDDDVIVISWVYECV